MSWLSRSSALRDTDWGLLDFDPVSNEAFVMSKRDVSYQEQLDSTHGQIAHLEASATSTDHKLLSNEADLEKWLRGLGNPQSQDVDMENKEGDAFTTINLLLARRTSSLDELPFTQQDFTKVASKLKIHRSIIRAINRNTSCTFSKMPYNWLCNDSTVRSIVYNCRTAASWEGDMALSVTFFPESLMTNAVWYGCDLSQHDIDGHFLSDAEVITGQIINFDGGVFHPMLLPTIFADFERNRQIGLVRKCLPELVQRVHDLARPDARSIEESSHEVSQIQEMEPRNKNREFRHWESLAAVLQRFFGLIGPRDGGHVPQTPKTCSPTSYSEAQENLRPAVLLWMDISFLRIGLQNWQTQLRKMIEHVEEFDATNFTIGAAAQNKEWEARLAALREVGSRIRRKLQDLVDEYDEYIRQCTHIMDGMTLATQLELNDIGRKDARTNQEISRVNLEVAKMARHDGSLMKSIATLGMVFLPATFVSTFFSMGFFQWTREEGTDGQILSPYFWVYVVITVALTILTMAIFYSCALRRSDAQADNEYKIA